MKYTLLTIIFLSSLFQSCKSDGDDLYIIPEPGPKTKKIIHNLKLTKTIGVDDKFDPIYKTFTYEFFYENGQVTKLANTEINDYSVFEYDKDNKITKMINYSNNTIFNTINFYYTNNLLTSSVTTDNNNVISTRNEFNYTQGLLTSLESLTGSITNTNQYTYYPTKNLESITNIELNYKNVYLYDQEINPFREYNPYFKILNNNLIYNTLSNNNPLTEKIYSDSNVAEDKTIIYEITYDNENYPVNIIGKDAVTGRMWSSYDFNYQTIIVP